MEETWTRKPWQQIRFWVKNGASGVQEERERWGETMVAWRFTVAVKRYETKNRGAGGFNELSVSCNKSCNFRDWAAAQLTRENALLLERRGGKWWRSGKKSRKDNKINNGVEELNRKQREGLCLEWLDRSLYYIIGEPNGSGLRSCCRVVKRQLTWTIGEFWGSRVQKFMRFTINGELNATTPLPHLSVWRLHGFPM